MSSWPGIVYWIICMIYRLFGLFVIPTQVACWSHASKFGLFCSEHIVWIALYSELTHLWSLLRFVYFIYYLSWLTTAIFSQIVILSSSGQPSCLFLAQRSSLWQLAIKSAIIMEICTPFSPQRFSSRFCRHKSALLCSDRNTGRNRRHIFQILY